MGGEWFGGGWFGAWSPSATDASGDGTTNIAGLRVLHRMEQTATLADWLAVKAAGFDTVVIRAPNGYTTANFDSTFQNLATLSGLKVLVAVGDYFSTAGAVTDATIDSLITSWSGFALFIGYVAYNEPNLVPMTVAAFDSIVTYLRARDATHAIGVTLAPTNMTSAYVDRQTCDFYILDFFPYVNRTIGSVNPWGTSWAPPYPGHPTIPGLAPWPAVGYSTTNTFAPDYANRCKYYAQQFRLLTGNAQASVHGLLIASGGDGSTTVFQEVPAGGIYKQWRAYSEMGVNDGIHVYGWSDPAVFVGNLTARARWLDGEIQEAVTYEKTKTRPWVVCEAALTSLPNTTLASPASFDSLLHWRSINIRRGRQDELNTIQVGTCDVVLDNATGRLSPENSAGIYSPNVLVRTRLRIVATWQGVTYTLFYGRIQSYTPIDNGPLDADMRITAVDWLDKLNRQKIGTAIAPVSYVGQTDSARVTAVLAAALSGNDVDLVQQIDPFTDRVVSVTLAGVPATSHIADVVAATRGLFYQSAVGAITWESRWHRLQASPSLNVQVTFGQMVAGAYPAGTLPFISMEYVLEDRDIINDARINATSTTEGQQIRTNAASQTAYDIVTYQLDSAVMDINAADYMAQWLVLAYSVPKSRIHGTHVDPDANTLLWPQILAREISDRIHIVKATPGALSTARDMFIEGVEHALTPTTFATTYRLSDVALLGPRAFRLDISLLDGSDGLAY